MINRTLFLNTQGYHNLAMKNLREHSLGSIESDVRKGFG